jgi:hypothetical protein
MAGRSVSGQSSESRVAPVVFDAEALGASFRELGVDVVDGEQTTFMSRWFHSRQDADLFIWVDGDKRIIKHQMCLFGQVIEWNPLDGTRTGVIIEEEIAALGEEPAEVIRFDPKAEEAAVHQAMTVLSHLNELSHQDRDLLIHNLRESPKLHPKARERALKAWAPKADEISSTRRPTFWKRLKSWVLG